MEDHQSSPFMNPNSPKPRKSIRIVYPVLDGKRESLSATKPEAYIIDKKIKRVLAPFVKIVRREHKKHEEKLPEDTERFRQYANDQPFLLKEDLSAFLSNRIDLIPLLNQTADVLKEVTNAFGVTVYLIDKQKGELHLSPRNVTMGRHNVNWKIEPGKSLAAYVAYSMDYVMVEDVLKDQRFPEGIPYIERAKGVLAAPVLTEQGSCYAVIELYRDATEEPFDEDDSKILIIVVGWMGAAIDQNDKRLNLEKQQELNNYLLNLTNCFFADNIHTESMISQVVGFAKDTLGAERGSFFIIHPDTNPMKATMYDEGISSQEEGTLYKRNQKVNFSDTKGIPSFVAKDGNLLNIADAYNDKRFRKEVDALSGCITRSILCVPIKAVDEVVGIIQVINKKNGPSFTKSDEELLTIFGNYCALALHYIRLQTKNKRIDKLNDCYSQMLEYHMQPCIHFVQQYESVINISPDELPKGFDKFSWYIQTEQMYMCPMLLNYMHLEIFEPNLVDQNALLIFILSVQKGYRDNPYHNFEHGFNVCHCMYLLLVRNREHFSNIELTALILASYGHDLDHRGYTNNFLTLTNDILSQLYDDSPLENHHYLVTMKLIRDTHLLDCLPEVQFKELDMEIKNAILATDLANHFKCRARLLQVMHDGSFEWHNTIHRQLIKDLMMTAADLSGQCKPYAIAQNLTNALCKEFYNQGDKEKDMGLCPLALMDRERQNLLPEGQIQFLTVLVKPCTELLSYFFQNCKELFLGAEKLCATWEQIIQLRGVDSWCQEESVIQE